MKSFANLANDFSRNSDDSLILLEMSLLAFRAFHAVQFVSVDDSRGLALRTGLLLQPRVDFHFFTAVQTEMRFVIGDGKRSVFAGMVNVDLLSLLVDVEGVPFIPGVDREAAGSTGEADAGCHPGLLKPGITIQESLRVLLPNDT